MNNNIIILIICIGAFFVINLTSSNITDKEPKGIFEYIVMPDFHVLKKTEINVFKIHNNFITNKLSEYINANSLLTASSSEIGFALFVNALNEDLEFYENKPLDNKSVNQTKGLENNSIESLKILATKNENLIVKSKNIELKSEDLVTEIKINPTLFLNESNTIEEDMSLEIFDKVDNEYDGRAIVNQAKEANNNNEEIILKQENLELDNIINNTSDAEKLVDSMLNSQSYETSDNNYSDKKEIVKEEINYIELMDNLIKIYSLKNEPPSFKKEAKIFITQNMIVGLLTKNDVISIFAENAKSSISKKDIKKYIKNNK